MSGFDTAQFERARQGGAQLGTQQFGMLADLANRREQNRMDQEALQQRAQQIQFGQSMDVQQMDLARQRFGLDQRRESRLNEAFRMEMDQYAAQVQQAEVAKAQKMEYARQYGKVLINDLKKGAASQQPVGQRQEMEAMGFTPPKNPIGDALRQMPGGGVEDPMEAINQRDIERMIEILAINGDMDGLTAVAPAVDSALKRAEIMQRTKWAIQAVGNPELIADPKIRAVAMAFATAGKEDAVWRLLENQVKTDEQIRKENATQKPAAAGNGAARGNAVGSLYAGMATNAAKGAKDGKMKSGQASQYSRFMSAAAAAKANPDAVLPDGSVVMNNGQVGPDGFIRLQRPDGREEAVSPEQFAAMVAPGMLGGGESAPTGGGVPDLAQDFDTVLDRFMAENPGATPEQVAAEMERRGFVIPE